MKVVFIKVLFSLIGFSFIYITKKLDDESIKETKIHLMFKAWVPTFPASITRWIMYIIGALLILLAILIKD